MANKIDKLINELCPDGIEFKELGEVCKITTGKLNANAMIEKGKYPFFTCAEKPFLIDTFAFDTEAILISGNGSQVGHINYYKGKFNAYQRTYVLFDFINEISVFFLLHYLKNNLKEYILKNVKEGSVPYITLPMLESFKIPIPPLPIQEEIVKILDTFTKLETELETKLEAELEDRKKQYEYYRDELLTFGDEVEFKELGEVIAFMNGKGHEKNIDENGEFIVVNSKFVSTEGKIKKYSLTQICPLFKNSVLMVMSDLPNGKALAKCFFVESDNKYTLNQRICSLTVKNTDELFGKYLYYALNRNKQLLAYDNGVDQTNLRKDNILKIKIPLPPLQEQERIVAILDKFDALVNDISVGLPAELSARKKQYEYFREKLLTFKEVEE